MKELPIILKNISLTLSHLAYGAISREVEDLDEMAFFGGGGDLIRSRRIFMATLNALEAVDCVNIDIECLNTTYTQQEKSL